LSNARQQLGLSLAAAAEIRLFLLFLAGDTTLLFTGVPQHGKQFERFIETQPD
jgi:hypothetical protein